MRRRLAAKEDYIMEVRAIARLEPDSIEDEGIVALVWCELCPLNAPPSGDEAYAVMACGDITIKQGEHCSFWKGYQIDKNRRLLIGCRHPDWTYGPGRWLG
jgi:hypothetical protein